MFGMIASVGLSNLQFVNKFRTESFHHRLSIFMGLSVPEYFANDANLFAFEPLGEHLNTLGKTGMAVGAFTALIFDNTIPGTDEERGLVAWQSGE